MNFLPHANLTGCRPYQPETEASCFEHSAVELLTRIHYLDCITVSGCQGLICNFGYLKWLFCMDAEPALSCRCKNLLMSGMQMHFCFLYVHTQTNAFWPAERMEFDMPRWRTTEVHLLCILCLTFQFLSSRCHSARMHELFLLRAWCLNCFFFFLSSTFQYPLHRGCGALDGEYHNDIIHMQPGLGNPSDAETKTIKKKKRTMNYWRASEK